eukprot:scaffold431693_cov15-Prasinocladus_malaysianus.AAC.1
MSPWNSRLPAVRESIGASSAYEYEYNVATGARLLKGTSTRTFSGSCLDRRILPVPLPNPYPRSFVFISSRKSIRYEYEYQLITRTSYELYECLSTSTSSEYYFIGARDANCTQ